MTTHTAADLIRQALMTAFWVCLPLLGIGFVAGIVLNLIQLVTSIQDPSFSAIPRMLTFLAATAVLLPWILIRLVNYTVILFSDFSRYAQ